MELESIDLNKQSCQELSNLKVLSLKLNDCELNNKGTALVKSVQSDCFGLTSLNVCQDLVDISILLNAIQSQNCCLKGLFLHGIYRDHLQALPGALRRNTHLEHFGFYSVGEMDSQSWTNMCDSISIHPSLIKLDFHHRCLSCGHQAKEGC